MIGDVLQAKCWNWQLRKDIGHMKPSAPPSGVDYDTWVGPAEWMPFQANRFHYDWHWWYNFGCGDLGNDGIHEFDYALWGLGVDTHPTLVSAAGGKYFFDDDQQFPDTQQVTFEFRATARSATAGCLSSSSGCGRRRIRTTSTAAPSSSARRARCSSASAASSKSAASGIEPLDVKLDGSPKSEVRRESAELARLHQVGRRAERERRHRRPHGHRRPPGNIATRLQRTIHFDPATEKIIGDDEANALLTRKYREGGHWGIPAGV